MSKQEHVLAVTAESVKRVFNNDGEFFDFKEVTEAGVNFEPTDIVVMSRETLETDENYRQIIPYAVVVNENLEVLVYKRALGGTEERLHDLLSIGFGGHVGVRDLEPYQATISVPASSHQAMIRELQEELGDRGLGGEVNIINVGAITTLETPVDRVHVGILSIVRIFGDTGIIGEENHVEIVGFLPAEQVLEKMESLESWSQIAIKKVIDVLSNKELMSASVLPAE